jgi:4-amino-4-deoxy-L-arabinose transferase-like glycosyltransferase
MNKKLILIIFIAFILRLYKIDIPLADHHSWRQADTAAVARNFVKEGWHFLTPTIDNMTFLSNPSMPNPQRLFLVEPPIYQTIIAVFYKVFGVRESFARLISIIFSLGSIIFLYLLIKEMIDEKTALWASFFFAVLPYSVYYSRVILPEPFIIFLGLGLIYFFYKWISTDSHLFWILTIIFGSIALTQKIYPFFLFLPLLYLLFKQESYKFLKNKKFWITAIIVILPFIAWRLWINQFPEGIPPNEWLLNQGDIRFKGAFFWWIFYQRIGSLILGGWGLILLGIGLVILPNKKEGWFFHILFLSRILFVVIFAAGNVTHDYYQAPLIPIIAIFMAKGTTFLLDKENRFIHHWLSTAMLVVFIIFTLAFSWYQVRDYYNIQGGVDLAGRAVGELTPKNSLVLTGDTNDATLLYNTNRHGWTGGYASYYPNISDSIQKIKQMGGTVYVTTQWNSLAQTDFGKYMQENYFIIKQTDQYIVFDLTKK